MATSLKVTLTRVLKFPSDDTVPLVEFERKIAMTLYPFSVVCTDGLETMIRNKEYDIQGYITVSDVGRMAMGSSKSDLPLESV